MTAAPTPSAEELDMLEKLLRPGSQGTCAMCDQVCDTAADALKALRQQVAELRKRSFEYDEYRKASAIESELLEAELTASRERVERLQTGIREVIPEIVKYVGHIPDRKFTIGNVIRKLAALAPASDAKEGKS